MSSAAGTIEQLARDTVQIADPETALRALTALRAELDATEPELVQRALQTGASWSQIARALGVTKQAAHRKYRHLLEHAETPTSGPKILVTSEARRAIQYAREEAKRLGQPAVGTEHILLGILRCEQSHAVKALGTLGVTLERTRACLQTTMPGVPLTDEGEVRDDGVSAHGRRILEGSLREALKRGEGYIGVEHLLLALLADSRNGAVQTLEELRTTPAQIRRQLDQEWAAVAPVAPAPESGAAGAAAQAASNL
jgi:ATP-dependent Clp protease ATP-binding subunit ClpA